MIDIPLLPILIYAFTLWLGLYLIARDGHKPLLVFTGLGLVAYALIMPVDILTRPPFPQSDFLQRIHVPLLFAPALCWLGAALHLLPSGRWQRWLTLGVRFAVSGALLYLYYSVIGHAPRPPITEAVYLSLIFNQLGGWLVFGLLVSMGLVLWRLWQERRKRWWLILLTIALFFTLSSGMLVFVNDFVWRDIALLLVGADLLVLGICIAVLDAFDEGETLLPDATHSLFRAELVALIFGGQVLIVAGGQIGENMLLLLFGVIGAAIASQVFSDLIQSAADRLLFARFPQMRRSRNELRETISALPRADDSLDLNSLPTEEFTRLTRRALSHMTDPGKLAASPLLRLPLVETRLAAKTASANTLERAAELKLLLAETIQRLKPPGDTTSGTGDEWRFYNALYYPYVRGLKPLSRRLPDEVDADTQRVLEWFRIAVPERTLYNWQNAAARLVAQDLREQMGQNGSDLR
ncbi:MAG: hypothetical protein R3E39_28495 [Anaerolineae bacterium]